METHQAELFSLGQTASTTNLPIYRPIFAVIHSEIGYCLCIDLGGSSTDWNFVGLKLVARVVWEILPILEKIFLILRGGIGLLCLITFQSKMNIGLLVVAVFVGIRSAGRLWTSRLVLRDGAWRSRVSPSTIYSCSNTFLLFNFLKVHQQLTSLTDCIGLGVTYIYSITLRMIFSGVRDYYPSFISLFSIMFTGVHSQTSYWVGGG